MATRLLSNESAEYINNATREAHLALDWMEQEALDAYHQAMDRIRELSQSLGRRARVK